MLADFLLDGVGRLSRVISVRVGMILTVAGLVSVLVIRLFGKDRSMTITNVGGVAQIVVDRAGRSMWRG